MRHTLQQALLLLVALLVIPACGETGTGATADPSDLVQQHEEAFTRYLGLIEEAGASLHSASSHQDSDKAIAELRAVIIKMEALRDEVIALEPLNNEQMRKVTEKVEPEIQPAMAQMRQGMEQVVVIKPLKEALDPTMADLAVVINSINSPTIEQRQEALAGVVPQPISSGPEGTAADPLPSEDPVAPSAYVVIQNAGSRDTQLLVRQLQQVLPKTQVVKVAQSPDTREIKLEVTNVRDVRALANQIPFASVESVDVAKRTITVDFDL